MQLFGGPNLELFQCRVRMSFHAPPEPIQRLFIELSTPITARCTRGHLTMVPPPLFQASYPRFADPEMPGHVTGAFAAIARGKNPLSQIQ